MILCSGCFDGLHAGHVKYLQAAKRLGGGRDLHVAIAPDTYIRAAKHRDPYWPQTDRAHTVFALACVDDVHLQVEETPAKLIREKRPVFFAKGPDWKGQLPKDIVDACIDVGTRILYTETPGKHGREACG